jgi:hypothetical protein
MSARDWRTAGSALGDVGYAEETLELRRVSGLSSGAPIGSLGP